MITAFPTQQELLSLFDYRDGVLYWKETGRSNQRDLSKPAGYVCKTLGYACVKVKGVLYRSHRLIWCMFHGYEPSEIDHINRKKADNRIENLREVSRSENNYNHPVHARSTSGVKGVSWNKQRNNWRVYVALDNKTLHIGSFKDFELACLVAAEARDKYHGFPA